MFDFAGDWQCWLCVFFWHAEANWKSGKCGRGSPASENVEDSGRGRRKSAVPGGEWRPRRRSAPAKRPGNVYRVKTSGLQCGLGCNQRPYWWMCFKRILLDYNVEYYNLPAGKKTHDWTRKLGNWRVSGGADSIFIQVFPRTSSQTF